MKTERIVLWARIIVLGSLIVLGLLGCYSLVSGWLKEPAELLDVENVKAEYEWFYSQRRGLEAIRAGVRELEWQLEQITSLYGTDPEKWSFVVRSEYGQLVTMKVQQRTAYNMQCAKYLARWDNIFHNIVAPKDIPRDCGE